MSSENSVVPSVHWQRPTSSSTSILAYDWEYSPLTDYTKLLRETEFNLLNPTETKKQYSWVFNILPPQKEGPAQGYNLVECHMHGDEKGDKLGKTICNGVNAFDAMNRAAHAMCCSVICLQDKRDGKILLVLEPM